MERRQDNSSQGDARTDPDTLDEEQSLAHAGIPGGAGAVSFGSFRLWVAQRRLERDGAPVALGAKAFDILAALVRRAGEVVPKAELLRQVWRGGVADEASLRFHISALRKALGEGRYIANVAGLGYTFVATITPDAHPTTPDAHPDAQPRLRALPPRPRRLVGREKVLEVLADQLLTHRFVTIVGPGGVGKTSVALALAHDLASRFDGEACFFDVESVFEPTLLIDGLASALGFAAKPTAAAPGIIPLLRQRSMLLVLDGCEAAIDAAAALAEEIVQGAPQVRLLATSREALRADGEHVHRLFPLSCPPEDTEQSAEQALEYPAVRLFVDRVEAIQHGFALSDEDAPLVSRICRKLDGLALAIELAAGRVDAYGVREVSRRLDSTFALMWPGRRTAVARHQTLSATLDWSHQLLSEPEQVVFRRLAAFAGPFTLEMAGAVVPDATLSRPEVTDLLGSLVSKSLVQFEADGPHAVYRLLDMTRSYALEKLIEAGGVDSLAERHARFVLGRLESAAINPRAEGGVTVVDQLGDLRAALEWSLSRHDAGDLAAALAAHSAPVWLQSGLLAECRYWMNRALDSIDPAILGPQRRLAIQAALASALTFTQGFSDASLEIWSRTFAMAQSYADVEQQLVSLVVLWAQQIRSPDYSEAMSLARQVEELAAPVPDPGARAMADWMVGITRHHRGELHSARPLLERALAGDTVTSRQVMMSRFGYDRRVPTLGVLSNLCWLEGRADEALRLGALAVAEARRLPYPVPLCEALTWHALNLHFRGEHPDQIDPLLDEVIAHAQSHFIGSYEGLGLAIKGLSLAARGESAEAAIVADGLQRLAKANYEVFHPLFQTEWARLKVQAGERLSDREIDALLPLAEGAEHWASAEVRRNLGEILLQHGRPDRARQLLAGAVSQAERQGAWAWALRASLSLARSETETGARERARSRVESLRAMIAEGEGTADLQVADLFLAGSRIISDGIV